MARDISTPTGIANWIITECGYSPPSSRDRALYIVSAATPGLRAGERREAVIRALLEWKP